MQVKVINTNSCNLNSLTNVINNLGHNCQVIDKEKDLEKLDIEIPILSPRIIREYKNLEDLDIDNFIFEWATNEVVDIQLKYATLLTKSTSSFEQVNFYARELTPDYDPWVVFPYEQWWNFKEIG